VRYLIGVGTYAAGDDAIGLRIVEEIVEKGLDQGFRAIDLSSTALNLLVYLTPETEAVLIVDSAKMGMAAGEARFFAPDAIETRQQHAPVSTHESGVSDALALAVAMGWSLPRIGIMGIEPGTLEPKIGLSAALGDRLSGYVARAIARLMEI
jgi:hydrogenase maturation protease